MSHIYKAVMLQAIANNGGTASKEEIARAFLARDYFAIEHYRKNIVHQMPGNRLVRDSILEKEGDEYRFADGLGSLSNANLMDIAAACEHRIESFIENYGAPFKAKNEKAVPGSVRYEVLKRAGGRCELCGVSHEEIELHVDHILPRAKGGSNEQSNLQALCRTCNTNKRENDDIDWRRVKDAFQYREADCVFCDIQEDRNLLAENELAVCFADGYPVTDGHSLIIPRRHVADYFDLFQSEKNAIEELLLARKQFLTQQDKTIQGFNIGINVGATAGQTVFHCHVHLIPRRSGDQEDPKGGVRGVIPEKQKY